MHNGRNLAYLWIKPYCYCVQEYSPLRHSRVFNPSLIRLDSRCLKESVKNSCSHTNGQSYSCLCTRSTILPIPPRRIKHHDERLPFSTLTTFDAIRVGIYHRLQPSILGEMSVTREITSLVQGCGRSEERVPGIPSVSKIFVFALPELRASAEDSRCDESRPCRVVEVAVGGRWLVGVVREYVSRILR